MSEANLVVILPERDVEAIASTIMSSVREEVQGNPYLQEAMTVLKAGGLRSAIGSYWNAVVDDLRNKAMHRSLSLFNKEMNKNVKIYEDFQDSVTDKDLIDGCYKIGVIDWEAKKILHQARETRNIFDGHPRSSNPHILKVLSMITDCNRYVLSRDYPLSIIDINEYINKMDSESYNRNELLVDQALADLPEIYKVELVNMLYGAYTHESSSTTLRANIEFCLPILWKELTKETKNQIGKRFDREMLDGNKDKTELAIDFLIKINGLRYVSTASRKCIFEPVIKYLEENLDDWSKEADAVKKLSILGTNIPKTLIGRYVTCLTKTFVGYIGSSYQFNRKDFYSNGAESHVLKLFSLLDDYAVEAFRGALETDRELIKRVLEGEVKLKRVQKLASVLSSREGIRADLLLFLKELEAISFDKFVKTNKSRIR